MTRSWNSRKPVMASYPALACSAVGIRRGGPHEIVGPAQEVVVCVLVEPEQVGDHHERQQRRHVPHEVAPTVLADAVEDPLAQGHDRRFHLGDPARREAPVHQPAALAMLGIVHGDHHGQVHAVGPRGPVAREGGWVLLHRQHVGVRGDAPHVGRLVVVDGRLSGASRTRPRAGRRRTRRRRAG